MIEEHDASVRCVSSKAGILPEERGLATSERRCPQVPFLVAWLPSRQVEQHGRAVRTEVRSNDPCPIAGSSTSATRAADPIAHRGPHRIRDCQARTHAVLSTILPPRTPQIACQHGGSRAVLTARKLRIGGMNPSTENGTTAK